MKIVVMIIFRIEIVVDDNFQNERVCACFETAVTPILHFGVPITAILYGHIDRRQTAYITAPVVNPYP
jgi:hypothetical protein